MDYRRIIDKLEHDLSCYLIDELTKKDPSKRQSTDIYRYKGLTITANPRTKIHDKTIFIRIGLLEAEFKISSGEKSSGGLGLKEEKFISIWMQQPKIANLIRQIFNLDENKREISIVPFELDDVFDKSN